MMKYIVFCGLLGFAFACNSTGYGNVAFTALVSKDITVASMAVVKYDHVLTNLGGAYQPKTGVFTVPYNGIYTISCSLLSHPANYVHLDIMKNKAVLSTLFAAAKTHPHSGQTLQLVLKKGDKIWVRNANNKPRMLHDRKVYNMFSGVLIQECFDDQ
ncbi:complement C1q-like protein 3 [Ostrea edulis]|uniref:complement C1q-like protein 3 n=1 Tax=Ostrea edulis TaxID=37623 RepID=UPI0024AFBB41|nr:complement C1q-like protein 3 [Ostrea edulis]XP_056009954.1 complement C1q-like protein 3 [Ostrea edulis]